MLLFTSSIDPREKGHLHVCERMAETDVAQSCLGEKSYACLKNCQNLSHSYQFSTLLVERVIATLDQQPNI